MTWRPNPQSVRVRALALATFIVLLPATLTLASFVRERSAEHRLLQQTESAAKAVRELIARGELTAEQPDALLRALGADRRVRIDVRIGSKAPWIRGGGAPESDFIHAVGAFVWGKDGQSAEAFDRQLGPAEHRPEMQATREQAPSAGCRSSTGARILLCYYLSRESDGSLIYAELGERRSLRWLYEMRDRVARGTLFLLPLALALAWWIAVKLVRPLERLRDDALRLASMNVPRGTLSNVGNGEVAELRDAFEALTHRLESRRQEHERFVADLVHELKGPASTIVALSERLAALSDQDEKMGRLARISAESAARLSRIANQILKLSRADAGLSPEEVGVVELGPLVRGAAEAYASREPDVLYKLAVDETVKVMGAEGQLSTLLSNLLENATTFAKRADRMNPGAAPEVSIELATRDKWAILRVTDSGPGVLAEDLPKLMTRFFTTRRDQGGTGLGLAMVSSIAESHGGKVRVASTPGAGATFEVELPL